MPSIELASECDGPSILEISGNVAVFNDAELDCVDELWEAYQDKGEASGYVFVVSRDDGQVSGYASFGPHPLTAGTFDLYWIAVAPQAQGQGIGRGLVARVESEVIARGGRLLLVETSDSPPYQPARELYESCGYHCEAVVRDFYAPGDSLLIYAKPLAGLTAPGSSGAHSPRGSCGNPT